MADIAAFQEVLLPLAALQTRHHHFSQLGRLSSSRRPPAPVGERALAGCVAR